MPGTNDKWNASSAYETFMGRWSRQLAPRYVSWLDAPRAAHWLDVGCGTGALSVAICENAEPASVLGCDSSAAFIDHARTVSTDARVSFAVAGVGSLPARDGGYGVVASQFALNFFPDHTAAVTEMRRLAAPGATVSACVWDYAGRMEFLRRFWDAACEEDAGARELDEGLRFPICRPDALEELFTSRDLRDVSCENIDITTRFSGFDDFWAPFHGETGPAPTFVDSLDESRREALAERLRRSLPTAADGTISLIARAWVVRGTV